ncbi:TIGR00266 family protein [Thioflavicoccus mobilis 8321]|uniref:TIGR00266 family protein n=1 Tax=Thioflavicoccus mobilis 8321 TaxID=765912 RepID=L0GUN1_9GAMM|nr:TIGR00266 family protein [Thioflavicoccus mobilis]AGA89527.1 TIGR00266 family protein [Thioflavicoccus mobilis 8321]
MTAPSSDLQTIGGLTFRVHYRGAFALLEVHLQPQQTIKAQSDAMVAMDPTIDVEGKLEGGLLGGLGRMFSGESFFFQTLRAARGSGVALLAPAQPGDLLPVHLDGTQPYIIQKDGFLAASEEVQISTAAQNLARGIFSGEGFFVLRAQGRGMLFAESYGAIHALEVPAGEEMVVDNGHLVAWPEGMHYSLEKASSGWISSFTSGEGLVCRFRGPGTVYIQSRNPKAFGSWLSRLLPSRGN